MVVVVDVVVVDVVVVVLVVVVVVVVTTYKIYLHTLNIKFSANSE